MLHPVVVPVLRLAAHKLRARWRSWVVLALLTGLAGGAVLTAAAGALRTETAYPRLLTRSNASDLLIAPAGSGFSGYFQALGKLPQVAAIGMVAGLNIEPLNPDGTVDNVANVVAPVDGRFGRTIDVPKLLAGRQPLPDRAGEVAVDQIGARDLHLKVGSTLRLAMLPQGPAVRLGPTLTERVVGIMVARGSVEPVTYQDRGPTILASTALFREVGTRYLGYDGVFVKLRPGASSAAVTDSAQALASRFRDTGGQVFVADETAQAATIERAIRPQAVGLALFVLALALCTLLIVGQLAARLLLAASGDNGTLAALGMTRGQLMAASLAEMAAAAAAGAAIACAIAVAASPLMPIGPARLAEPDPGVRADGSVLAVGFAAIVILLLARITRLAWRQATTRPATERDPAAPPERRSTTAERLAQLGAPLAIVTGVRLALDSGRGRAAVPARGAALGLAVAVAAVAGAATFGANLLRLVDTPRLYGQDWDVAVDLQFATLAPAQFDHLVARVPGIADLTFGVHGTVGIGKALIPAIGLDAGRGRLLSATVLDGRPPRTGGEIVLGSSVLRQFGLHVGQSVAVTVAGKRGTDRIVGSAVFPFFGEGSFTPTDVGQGAETTASVLAPQSRSAGGGGYNFVLARFAPGPLVAQQVATFEHVLNGFCATVEQSSCVLTDQRPNTVTNYASIDATPAVLAAILAVLGLAVLAQFTVISARRRRHDFAVMKALGMLRRQLRAITFWQVSTVTAVALVIGAPLGVAGGRGGARSGSPRRALPGPSTAAQAA